MELLLEETQLVLEVLTQDLKHMILILVLIDEQVETDQINPVALRILEKEVMDHIWHKAEGLDIEKGVL